MKKGYFILLVFFTLCLSHNNVYACGSKKACKKEMSESKLDKCCNKKCCSNSEGQSNGCNGKCGHTNCVNPTINIIGNIPAIQPDFQTKYLVFSAKAESFFYKQPRLTKGHYTIWLIPKISLS